jgi:uncharacterized membrane protein YfcA
VGNGYFLALMGFITGLIDAIAGGGGLISVPAYMLVLGPGAEAIATNKVSAFCSTLTALYIYFRKGFVTIDGHKSFFVSIFFGAIIGAYLSRYLSRDFYKVMMLVLAPLILWVLFKRHLWVESSEKKHPKIPLVVLGLFCGIYDGIAGPGGGTLMFLSLFVMGGVPLTTSIGTAKLANVFSSGSSLVTYVAMGKVHWQVAVPATCTIIVGAVIGARYATKNAAFYARVALAAVSLLILIRLVMEHF